MGTCGSGKLETLPSCLLILSLLLPFASAQWDNVWITKGDEDSVNLNSNDTAATLTIPEDTPIGALVARLHYNTATTLWTQCSPSALRFDLNDSANSSDVTLAILLDFEVPSVKYVRCILLLNSTLRKTIDVDVTNVNDNGPIFAANTPTSLVFEENKVGPLPYRFVATDEDVGDNAELKYSLQVANGGEHFVMRTVWSNGQNEGEINVTEALDYESEAFYIFTITVEDPVGHNFSIQAVLTVTDVNDLPPVWSKEVPVYRMPEDKKEGTELFNVTARDGDRGINDAIAYSLEDPSGNFDIDSTTGMIRLKREIDRDVLDVAFFDIKIVASEVGDPSKSSTTNSTIFIDDVNDNEPYFDPAGPYNMSVPENTTAGFYVGTVTAKDIDLANVISYTLASCDNEGQTYIDIKSSNGQVTVKDGNIDREKYDKFSCTVKVTDNGNPVPLSNQTEMVIHILDVNDNEPVFSSNMKKNYTIPEDTSNGTVVGQVQATDADSGEYGKVSYLFYRINDEGGDHFDVDMETGEIRVHLINGAVLDFDKKRSFSFYVEARDYYRPGTSSGSNSVVEKITVNLSDVNDNAPDLPPSDEDTCFASPSESYSPGTEVVTIDGFDEDEPGTDNSRIEYSILSQLSIPPTPNPQNAIFGIETANNKGVVKTTVQLDGYVGDYNIQVLAHDFGAPQRNSTAVYKICVRSFNGHAPTFHFPGPALTAVTVLENNTVNAPLLWRSNNQFTPLVFFANDSDKGENGVVTYSLAPENQPAVSEFFAVGQNDGVVLLQKEFIREEINNYTIIVKATDGGTPGDANGGQKSATASLLVKVAVVSQYRPEFASFSLNASFTENAFGSFEFPNATDRDNENLSDVDEREHIYYYVVDGNKEYFQVNNSSEAKLSNIKELDREDPPEILYVVVEASNDNFRPNDFDCSSPQIDCSLPSYLTIAIQITDVNDNAPTFEGTFSGGISSGYQKGRTILTFTSKDVDEGEDRVDSATYTLSSEYEASDSSLLGMSEPFTIKAKDLLLNFDVQDSMKGFLRFNVTATDTAGNHNTTSLTVYVVLLDSKVTFKFNNERVLVERYRSKIEDIFTGVYKYLCVIETITENAPDEQNQITTTVLSYFVDESVESPVSSTVIDSLKNDPEMTKALRLNFSALGLDLEEVKSVSEPEDLVQQLFFILFVVACIIILPLIALVVVLLLRGSDLNRKVKALSTTKFGSQDSGVNRIGATVPNTNQHALEGSNPIWSMEGFERQDDNMSESSGDSILIGVEDNPEFRNYQGSKKPLPVPDGGAPVPFQNVSRRNPLLDMNDSPPPAEMRQVKRPAPPPPRGFESRDSVSVTDDFEVDFGSDREEDVFDGQVNSNFSFGSEKLTSM